MEIVSRKPLRSEIGTFRKEIDRMFDTFFRDMPTGRSAALEWTPSIDISENKESLVVQAELPGVDADDVQVHLSGDILTLKGKKEKKSEDKDEHHYCCERYYGAFQRSFQLPAGVKADHVKAAFNKGILKIVFPKSEADSVKKIDIQTK